MRDSNRILDVVLAGLGLLLAAPLMALIATAIRLGDGGPALFASRRVGRGGATFCMHKFRTLVVGSERAHTVVTTDDPRVTRVGRWLRRTGMDELPQLYEVLRGRMALVGPRPERPDVLDAVPPAERRAVQSVRPGLTGPTQLEFLAEDRMLATVAAPDDAYRRLLVPAKVRHDLAWLQHRRWWRDLWVLARTPWVLASPVARSRSAHMVARLLAAE